MFPPNLGLGCESQLDLSCPRLHLNTTWFHFVLTNLLQV
jgi:hypothetical protein